MRDRLSARGLAVAWQLVVGLAAAGAGLLGAAFIGSSLVAPGSAGAYILVTVAVVTATVLAGWGWDRVTGLRAGHRRLPSPDRPQR
ncbi:hypothetical protein [Nocardia niigatensis]